MKPKPVSLQRRFTLLQAVTVSVAVWLLLAALLLGVKIQSALARPFHRLHEALALHLEFEVALDSLLEAGELSHLGLNEEARPALHLASEQLDTAIEGYRQLQISAEERALVEELDALRKEMARGAGLLMAAAGDHSREAAILLGLRRQRARVELLLDRIGKGQLARIDADLAAVNRYVVYLYAALMLCGVYAVAMLRVFRRTHRRHLWGPLEDLRLKVLQVKRGHLEIGNALPESVELRPLMESFHEMAAEVREVRDRLEQKVLERTARLEEAQQQLLRSAKLSALGQLVSGVAHEVNNPLTSILGFSEVLLSRSDLEPRLRAHAQTIRDEALRLKNVVANLTSFSGAKIHHMTRLDLRAVLERLVELRRYQLHVSSLRLHYEPSRQPVWVQGDPDQLLQVLFSIVLNAEQAIRAQRNDGDIWLTCRLDDPGVELAVRDNGPGMAPEVLTRIFDPFFTTRPRGQGTGMGLTVARNIVEEHGGQIAVESTAGQGSVFTVRLPLAAQEQPAPPAPEPQAVAAPVRRRALVVDDEPAIAQLLGQLLERAGWEHTALLDPLQLESALEGADFDLVLCDLKMPGRSGLEVLRLLRARRPALARRFLLMTGNLADASRESAELEGVTLLRKPFTMARLDEAVSQALGADLDAT